MRGRDISDIALEIICFVVAITVHEAAHAFAAYKCGDTTARDEGRLSLNPIDHIDPFGTVLLPLMLMISGAPVFGWAKPVPVDHRFLKDPKNDEYWISIAGPFSNFALAAVFAGLYRLMAHYSDSLVAMVPMHVLRFSVELIVTMLSINLVLFIFNLIPVPPLDGYHVVKSMLPDEIYERFELPPQAGLIFFIILMGSGVTSDIIRTFYTPLLNLLLGR